MNRCYDFVIVGAGIVGLAIARELKHRNPDSSVCVLEKEPGPAQHASGRNSGIIHAGFYYTAESLKAKLTADGNRTLTEFCLEKGVPINRCGKVVVAADGSEIAGVDELLRRGRINGIDVKEIDEKELRELEPAASTCRKALWSPTTSVVDPERVCKALADDLSEAGVDFLYGTKFIRRMGERSIVTSAGRFEYGVLINAAGLYADKVAHQYGVGREYTLLPFKGYYYAYGDAGLLKRHVYPVPNLANPFLGVHFTKTVGGGVKVGPTATPIFYRESYKVPRRFKPGEFVEIGLWDAQLFLGNYFGFRDLAFEEMRKYWKPAFIKMARRLLPSSRGEMFEGKLKPGIRAQLLNKKEKRLEMDFVIREGERSVHVLNAVSPAFTCALPFAKLVSDKAEALF